MTLFNDNGFVIIPSNHFINMSLSYDIINWSVDGALIYSDPFDGSERITLKDEPYSEVFYFKNDGSDKLRVQIGLDGTTPNVDTVFAIRDIIGSNSDISEKIKTIYFTDVLSHELSRTNVDVSSATVNNTFTSLSKLNNTDRNANVADMLVAIGEYTKANIIFDTTEKSGNTVFHTTFGDDNGLASFNYILKKYVGHDKTFGVVLYDHSNGNYNIHAIGTLISSYKEKIIEQFVISDGLRISDTAFNAYKNSRKTINLGVCSNIESYEYSKTSPIQNMQNNVNTSVATYRTLDKEFVVLNKELSIKNIKDEFINKIATPIQNGKSKTQAYPMLSIDKLRLEGQNTKELYTLNSDNIFNHVTDALKDMILLNDAISFQVVGNLDRKVGDIIELVSPNMENGRWSNRMFGNWIILNITHDITTEQYTNNIYAVKLSTNENMEMQNEA